MSVEKPTATSPDILVLTRNAEVCAELERSLAVSALPYVIIPFRTASKVLAFLESRIAVGLPPRVVLLDVFSLPSESAAFIAGHGAKPGASHIITGVICGGMDFDRWKPRADYVSRGIPSAGKIRQLHEISTKLDQLGIELRLPDCPSSKTELSASPRV